MLYGNGDLYMGNTSNNQSKLVPGVGRIPFPAYHGTEPYIFISYAHADHELVFPLIKEFHDRGYKVWYDEGIAPGNEWTADIARALRNCALIVAMITPNSVASANCKNEINFAIAKKIPFIAIHLQKTVLPDDLELQIGTKQAILQYNMTQEEFLYKYTNAFARFGLTGEDRTASAKGQDQGVSSVKESIPSAGTSGEKPPVSSKKYLVIAAAAAVVVLIGGLVMMNRKPSTSETTGQNSQGVEVIYATESGSDSQSQADAQTPSAETSADSAVAAADPDDQAGTTGSENTGADTQGADDYLYTEKYDGITLDKYARKDAAIVKVPEKIDGISVTSIGEKCFEDHNEIEEVILPDTVRAIRYNGFKGCTKLSRINIPSSLEVVGGWAFAHTGLREMIFTDKLKKLEYGAFNTCIKLEKVVLPETIVFLDQDTFRSCSRLTSVTIPSKDIDIDIKAFDENSRKLTIYGVKGSYAEKYANAMGLTFKEYQAEKEE